MTKQFFVRTTAGELQERNPQIRTRLEQIKGFEVPVTALTMPNISNPPEVAAYVALKKYFPYGVRDTRDYSKVVEIVFKALEEAV